MCIRRQKAIAICSWRGTDRARGVFAYGAASALWILVAQAIAATTSERPANLHFSLFGGEPLGTYS